MYGMSANDQHWMFRKGHKFVCGMQPLTALVTLISTWKRRNKTVYQTEQCGERRRGKKQKKPSLRRRPRIYDMTAYVSANAADYRQFLFMHVIAATAYM